MPLTSSVLQLATVKYAVEYDVPSSLPYRAASIKIVAIWCERESKNTEYGWVKFETDQKG